MNRLKHIAFLLMLKLGMHVTLATPKADIFQFLRNIRPLETDINLVRIGSENDGGYLVPDDLSDISGCLSPGVDNNSTFELQIANLGIPCWLMDFSVDGPTVMHDLFHFEKRFLSSRDEGKFISLSSWIQSTGLTSDHLLLQMDIEGAEYEVLASTGRTDINRFRIIVIEFHNFASIIERRFFEETRNIFERLLEDYYVVHLHVNNSDKPKKYHGLELFQVVEFTFLRKDRVKEVVGFSKVPHALDAPNSTSQPVVTTPEYWKT